jgi:hypothetical protein
VKNLERQPGVHKNHSVLTQARPTEAELAALHTRWASAIWLVSATCETTQRTLAVGVMSPSPVTAAGTHTIGFVLPAPLFAARAYAIDSMTSTELVPNGHCWAYFPGWHTGGCFILALSGVDIKSFENLFSEIPKRYFSELLK